MPSGTDRKGTRTHEALDNLVGSSRDRRGVFIGHGVRRERRSRPELRRSGGDRGRRRRRRPTPAAADEGREVAPRVTSSASRRGARRGDAAGPGSEAAASGAPKPQQGRGIRPPPKCWPWRPARPAANPPPPRRVDTSSGGSAGRRASRRRGGVQAVPERRPAPGGRGGPGGGCQAWPRAAGRTADGCPAAPGMAGPQCRGDDGEDGEARWSRCSGRGHGQGLADRVARACRAGRRPVARAVRPATMSPADFHTARRSRQGIPERTQSQGPRPARTKPPRSALQLEASAPRTRSSSRRSST